MTDKNKKRNSKKCLKYLYQLSLVILGALIALVSSRITQHWRKVDECKGLANHIKASVQNDIDSIEQLITMLQPYLQKPLERNLSPYSFHWQHESAFIQAVAVESGSLDLEVIKKLSKYYNMIEQSKSFRNILSESLKANEGDVNKSTRELQIYIEVLESQKSVGEDLFEIVEKKYP